MANILVIEDNNSFVPAVPQSVLGRLGHDVTLAQTGEAGVAAAARHRPDLIIMDLVLPEMSGAEVAEKLQTTGTVPAPPLIITTALGNSQALALTASLGAAGLLIKPFDINTLLTLVNETLSSPERRPPPQ